MASLAPTTQFVTETITTWSPQTTDNIVTSFVPLYSTFTPDPNCYTADFHNNLAEQFDYVLVAFDPNYGYYIGSSSVTCVPTEVVDWYRNRLVPTDTTAPAQTTSLATVTSLMPVICPDGWYTARTSADQPTRMQVTCCPSGYTVDPSQDHSIDANCGSTLVPGESIWYFPTSGTDIIQTAFANTINVVAVAVKGYMPLTTTTTTTTTSSSSSILPTTSAVISTSLTSSQPSATSTPNTPDPQTSSSHTSRGAIAGSVVGSLAGVALIGLGAFVYFRRRRAKQNNEDDAKDDPAPTYISTQHDYSVISQNEPGDRSTIASEMPTISNTPELFSDHEATSPRTNTESYELE
ncbi:hypothetical protein BGW36DRAFT_336927 [Talaromyces proteolyticus]|uniref:Epidermal growth factor receptor-like transmembrane-juxtamembrane segment domain-containing protein n=1 Tax=Talaromyces proteolyticus TaxID=1131652 RepID=A0AAD4Q491_9EURO|nr:uncharacterized protein BGW36DRAFT_336927 [Talaromyces proteolyticus]KAH8702442.1 hypothetical protein BGW36DRAFT_336927 [Talaromyces proteolyticus]